MSKLTIRISSFEYRKDYRQARLFGRRYKLIKTATVRQGREIAPPRWHVSERDPVTDAWIRDVGVAPRTAERAHALIARDLAGRAIVNLFKFLALAAKQES